MTANPFEQIRASKRDIVKSYDWYVRQIKNLGATRMRPSSMLKSEIGVLTNKLQVGRMYLFMYDPKLKATLPVYDRFPLVLPFTKTEDGFIGLNLHYLPYLLRAKLLGALLKLADKKDKTHPRMKLKMSWALIDSASRYPGVHVCVKRYLTHHIRSNFLEINPIDWRAAIFLPIEDFQKKSKDEVFRQSRSQL